MGVYGQPNSWQCGPFALKHALLSVGSFVHEDELTRVAGSSTDVGTDEHQLAKAARAHRCALPVARRGTVEGARSELEALLGRGFPVLLCVDNWDHWITAAAMYGDRIVVFDSHYDQPLRIEPWDALAARLVFRARGWRGMWQRSVYDLVPLVPAHPGHRLRLSPESVDYLLRPENSMLARNWDEQAAELLELAARPGRQLELGFPLADFLSSRRDSIITAVTRSSGLDAGSAAQRFLDDLRFVASLYGFTLRADRESVAIDHVAAHVARHLTSQRAAAA